VATSLAAECSRQPEPQASGAAEAGRLHASLRPAARAARRAQEWVDGIKLTDKAAMAAAGLDVVDFVDVGIYCTLEQLLGSAGYFAMYSQSLRNRAPQPYSRAHPGAGPREAPRSMRAAAAGSRRVTRRVAV